ncbi:MAG: membrane protein [Anaerolineales bacterium]
MFKPIRWHTFPRDFLVIQSGFLLFGFAIAMMIRANLGTSPWAVWEVAMASILHITPGTMTVIDGFIVLTLALAMREQVGWGTLANILSIGPWIDFALSLLPSIENNLPLQLTMLLGAIGMMGLASAIYIGVDAGAGPRDTLMLGIHRRFGWSVRAARASIEGVVVTLGWLLGGPVGVGTLVFALLIGSSVQGGFKLLHVQTRKPVEVATD